MVLFSVALVAAGSLVAYQYHKQNKHEKELIAAQMRSMETHLSKRHCWNLGRVDSFGTTFKHKAGQKNRW